MSSSLSRGRGPGSRTTGVAADLRRRMVIPRGRSPPDGETRSGGDWPARGSLFVEAQLERHVLARNGDAAIERERFLIGAEQPLVRLRERLALNVGLRGDRECIAGPRGLRCGF